MPHKSSVNITETDLYIPIRNYLEDQGYTVRGEVMNCDIAAVKGDELVMIEIKRSLNIQLLVQATQRQKITDSVYIAIPRPKKSIRASEWRGLRHLLRRLEIGLILVTTEPDNVSVKIAFHPLPFERKKLNRSKRVVIREVSARTGDFNLGGSTRKKLATAYRENAIHIACCLERFGPLSPRQLRELGTGPKTLSIISSNFYGWFERIDRGVYAIRSSIASDMEQFPELVERYRAQTEQQTHP